MKQETIKLFADGTNLLAVSTGIGSSAWKLLELWDFINTNAAGIGVLVSIFFGTVAILFHIYNAKKSNESVKNKKRIKELESQTKELENQMKSFHEKEQSKKAD